MEQHTDSKEGLMQRASGDDSIVVVGGGLAGLATAALLARDGGQVTLLERAAELGGRAQTTHAGGFHLNLGPHALYRGGEGVRVLTDLGVSHPRRRPEGVGGLRPRPRARRRAPGRLRVPAHDGPLRALRQARDRVVALGRRTDRRRRARPHDAPRVDLGARATSGRPAAARGARASGRPTPTPRRR